MSYALIAVVAFLVLFAIFLPFLIDWFFHDKELENALPDSLPEYSPAESAANIGMVGLSKQIAKDLYKSKDSEPANPDLAPYLDSSTYTLSWTPGGTDLRASHSTTKKKSKNKKKAKKKTKKTKK